MVRLPGGRRRDRGCPLHPLVVRHRVCGVGSALCWQLSVSCFSCLRSGIGYWVCGIGRRNFQGPSTVGAGRIPGPYHPSRGGRRPLALGHGPHKFLHEFIVEFRTLSCVKLRGPRCVHKSRSAVQCLQSCIRHDSHSAQEKQVCHRFSSGSCYMVAEPGLIQDLASNGDRAALGTAQPGDGATGSVGECLDAGATGQSSSRTTA